MVVLRRDLLRRSRRAGGGLVRGATLRSPVRDGPLVATQRDPSRYPAPNPLDFCAIGLSHYRDGRTVSYALNAHRGNAFRHQAEPFSVAVADSTLQRDDEGYTLRVRTPSREGRCRIVANLRFHRPASRRPAFERDLGGPGEPHLWSLAAPNCPVSGTIVLEGPGGVSTRFEGQGYHDHNAGSAELSSTLRRWAWGRFHDGPTTFLYYHVEPRQGPDMSLVLTVLEGRVTVLSDRPPQFSRWRSNPFGLIAPREVKVAESIRIVEATRVDDGPFYRRSLARAVMAPGREVVGISEWVDTQRLVHPIVRLMVPYRLKRPSEVNANTDSGSPSG